MKLRLEIIYAVFAFACCLLLSCKKTTSTSKPNCVLASSITTSANGSHQKLFYHYDSANVTLLSVIDTVWADSSNPTGWAAGHIYYTTTGLTMIIKNIPDSNSTLPTGVYTIDTLLFDNTKRILSHNFGVYSVTGPLYGFGDDTMLCNSNGDLFCLYSHQGPTSSDTTYTTNYYWDNGNMIKSASGTSTKYHTYYPDKPNIDITPILPYTLADIPTFNNKNLVASDSLPNSTVIHYSYVITDHFIAEVDRMSNSLSQASSKTVYSYFCK